MRLFLLYEDLYEGVLDRLEVLSKVAISQGVQPIVISSTECDWSDLPKLGLGDALYNVARGSTVLESMLLNPEVASFWRIVPDHVTITSTAMWSIVHDKHGLPAPRTIFSLTADRELLDGYVHALGGFPIVLKAASSTRGIGTIRVDSWQGLISLADYLTTTRQWFILREYVDSLFGARLMVLGGRVIASVKFYPQESDFRNAPVSDRTKYEDFDAGQVEADLAVRATELANLDMGGVDILYGRDGVARLLEVNFPTGFTSLPAAEDVAVQWIRYLAEKAAKLIDGRTS